MIKNSRAIASFEDSLVRQSTADYRRNLKIMEALYREACSLGILPLKDRLDDIDTDIRLARVLNVRKTA
jgi:hypothetical protein